MKRGIKMKFNVLLLSLLLILSIGFVSANVFGDFFNKLTGKVIDCYYQTTCLDSYTEKLTNGNAENGNLEGWVGFSDVKTPGRAGTGYAFYQKGFPYGSATFSTDFIEINYSNEYIQNGWFKASGANLSRVYYGYIPYDINKRFIIPNNVEYYPNTQTTLYAGCNSGDRIIKITNGNNWKNDSSGGKGLGIIAFNIDDSGNYNDLPNFDLSLGNVKNITNKGNYWEISLDNIVNKSYIAGTKIREHKSGNSYMYTSSAGVYVSNASWVRFNSSVKGESLLGNEPGKWRKGTKYARALLLLNYGNNYSEILFDDLSIVEKISNGNCITGCSNEYCNSLRNKIINFINLNSNGPLVCGDEKYNSSYDSNMDGEITSLDVLLTNSANGSFCFNQLTNPKDFCDICPDSNKCKIRNKVCQNLINRIVNPSNIVTDYNNYNYGQWKYNYSGEMWIDNKKHNYDEYSSSWSAYDNEKNVYINTRISIFEEEDIDLSEWIKQRTSYEVCKPDSYYIDGIKNVFYICNWDILRNEQNINNYKYESRQIFWINDNVIVEMNVYSGKSLTDEEVSKITQKKMNDFLEDLKNNQMEYIGWEYFDMNYLASYFIQDSLKMCESDVQMPIIDDTNETCYPQWSCKIEPVICPEHGYQTKTCIDYGCNNEERTDTIYCSPGICSGCYVPRWIDSKENKCIPYGFRFEQETYYEKELSEDTDEGQLQEGSNHEYNLTIVSENEALLTLFDKKGQAYEYTLIPGQEIEIKIPDWEDNIETIIVKTNKIVYSEDPEVKNYVDITATVKGWQNVAQKINAYCDIDGMVKQQKTIDEQRNWAKCQNNYECLSNICSSGECIEVTNAIKESGKFKTLFVKVLCKFSSLFNVDQYGTCVSNYLGGQVDSSDSGSNPPAMPE